MNVYPAKFKSSQTCVCIINDTDEYKYDKQFVINRADYTISNLTGIGYDVLEDQSIDRLLKTASKTYNYAIVISAGTEFINGNEFFNNHPTTYYLIGHILDGGDAYYGLHTQCFSINLETYKELGYPKFGNAEPFSTHSQMQPARSGDSVHDDYLPIWLKPGDNTASYKHKLPGWNLISKFLAGNFDIISYTESVRNNKLYLYNEGQTTNYIFQKYNYCLTEHVHTTATGDAANYPKPYSTNINTLVTPANKHAAELRGNAENIIYYDYNKNALKNVGNG